MKIVSEDNNIQSIDAVVTSYNESPDQIERTIASLLLQTIHIHTIFLVDDCSYPKLEIPLMDYGETCIKLIQNPVNLGISNSRNKAIEQSDANYIICLNIEVELKPEWLERTRKHLVDNPSSGCVFTQIEPIRNSIFSQWRFRFQEQKQPEVSGPFFMAPGHAVLFRRRDIISCGGYSPALKRIGEDFQVSRALKNIGLDSYYLNSSLAISHQNDTLSSLARKQLIRLIGNNPATYSRSSFFNIITRDFLNRFFRNGIRFRWYFLMIDLGIFGVLLGNCFTRNYQKWL